MDKRLIRAVEQLRPIDDDFFHKLAEDPKFCEEMLQVILQKKDLNIIKTVPQKSLKNIGSRSVILDVLCKDSDGNYYNIEVQKKNDDHHQKRVRYNESSLDTYISEKGTKFGELPDIYIVYLSSFDYFKENQTIYHVDRILRETGTIVNNGIHEIYVNTAIDDGTDIAGLMRIFKSTKAEQDERFPRICSRIRYFKEERGKTDMCSVVEEYAKEVAAEAVRKTASELILSNVEDAIIHRATKLSLEEIQSIRQNINYGIYSE